MNLKKELKKTMAKLFNNIRKKLVSDRPSATRTVNYLKYAIGEIVLVVIGILIALSINNWNEENKTKSKELIYLNSIKGDLILNITSLEDFIVAREQIVQSVDSLIEYFEGNRKLNKDHFNFHNLKVLEWSPFVQHSNTYKELMNSGNFAIISNNSIKNGLQNIQLIYESIAFIENEMQQDYERYLYDPYFNLVDLNSALKNYTDQMNNNVDIEEVDIIEMKTLLTNKLYKNGLILATYNSNNLLEEYSNVIEMSKHLIVLRDRKLENG